MSAEVEKVVAYKGEVMLAGWSESHTGGAKVTFFLSDPSELEAFRNMTVAKGKVAGQRLLLVAVEIGDDEQPIQQGAKPGKGPGLTRLAAMWCDHEAFQRWAKTTFPHSWAAAEASTAFGRPAEIAADVVRTVCAVKSRAEIDINPAAQRLFHDRIRLPYSATLTPEQR